MRIAGIILAAAAFLPTIGMADTTSTSGSASQSQSQSGVTLEGNEWGDNTPSVGGYGGNNTANCIMSYGAGVGQPGFGAGLSIPVIENNCLTERELAIVNRITDLQPGTIKWKAIVHHACTFSPRLRNTLVAVGYCAVRQR